MEIHLPNDPWALAALIGSGGFLVLILSYRLPAIISIWSIVAGRRTMVHPELGPIMPARVQEDAWRSKALQNIRMIADGCPDPVIFMTEQSIIEVVNGPFEALTGYSAGELVGSHLGILMPPEHAADHAETLDIYLRKRARQTVPRLVQLRTTQQLVRSNKQRCAVHMSITHITNGLSGFYAILRLAPPPIEERRRRPEDIGRPMVPPVPVHAIGDPDAPGRQVARPPQPTDQGDPYASFRGMPRPNQRR